MDFDPQKLINDGAHMQELVASTEWDILKGYAAQMVADHMRQMRDTSATEARLRYLQGVLAGVEMVTNCPGNVIRWAREASKPKA